MPRVDRVPVPARAHELAALDRVDYADCFSVAVARRHTPEEWIRAAGEVMPNIFSVARIAHHALGLRLGPADSPDHVIGWNVLLSDPDEAVLGTSGRLGEPRIVGFTPPGRVVLATLINLNGLTGRSLWAAAAPLHRAIARYALTTVSTLAPDADTSAAAGDSSSEQP